MKKLRQLAQNKIVGIMGLTLLALAVIPSAAHAGTKANGEACAAAADCASNSCVGGVCTSANVGATDFGIHETETGFTGTLGNKPLIQTITDLINVALGLLGIVAVVIVLIGGFKWMTAGGNDEKVDEGRKYIVSGVIGMAIILSAFAITKFVINSLSRATGSGTTTP